MQLLKRPRRNRKTEALRNMVAETQMKPSQLVLPIFICEGKKIQHEIKSMPGIYRTSLDIGLSQIETALRVGIKSVALFPYIDRHLRNDNATEALNPNGLTPKVIAQIKKEFPDLLLFSDIALDPFSSLGHDGLVANQKVLNDPTVAVLTEMALLHAQSGADFVAPSDMMDGRVLAIRKKLDSENFKDVGILSYAAKYASSFYGPFRDALESAPQFGDKKTYQMDFRNSLEALREAQLDVQEGADILMVKPALSYLDIIFRLKKQVQLPIAAYNVSGEYSMIKSASSSGWIDETRAMVETLYSMRRAGADLIFTYFAIPMANWLSKEG